MRIEREGASEQRQRDLRRQQEFQHAVKVPPDDPVQLSPLPTLAAPRMLTEPSRKTERREAARLAYEMH